MEKTDSSITVTFRVNTEEKTRIDRLSEKTKLNQSDLLRQLLKIAESNPIILEPGFSFDFHVTRLNFDREEKAKDREERRSLIDYQHKIDKDLEVFKDNLDDDKENHRLDNKIKYRLFEKALTDGAIVIDGKRTIKLGEFVERALPGPKDEQQTD
jgi:hypothetical protein